MCGLAGIILKQGNRKDKSIDTITKGFSRMLLQANTRGGHATGFALINNKGDYLIEKKAKDAYKFIYSPDALTALTLVDQSTTCIMGHTRYATLGSPSKNRNNHPIRTGKTIGTHNGSIHNHKHLFSKYNMKRYADVDSEAIFRLYETSKNARDFRVNRMPNVRGNVAIVWADLEYPDYIYMIKGNNPLELAFSRSLGAIVYGSTQKIIKSGKWSDLQRLKLQANTMLRINTKTFKVRKKNVSMKEPFSFANGYYNPKIGAYLKKQNKYDHTVSNFVPRYSYKDQQNLFKNVTCSDGSKIKKVK